MLHGLLDCLEDIFVNTSQALLVIIRVEKPLGCSYAREERVTVLRSEAETDNLLVDDAFAPHIYAPRIFNSFVDSDDLSNVF